jgi:hypothetical protein
MIHELTRQEIGKARSLFRPLEHPLFCRAVLERIEQNQRE